MWKNGEVIELAINACTCVIGSRARVIETEVEDRLDDVLLVRIQWIRPLVCIPEFADMNDGISEQMDGAYPVTWFRSIQSIQSRYDLIL